MKPLKAVFNFYYAYFYFCYYSAGVFCRALKVS